MLAALTWSLVFLFINVPLCLVGFRKSLLSVPFPHSSWSTAFLISSREWVNFSPLWERWIATTSWLLTINLVLELRKRTGPLSTQVFMSDDATQYWSAWTAAYSSINTTKLLCAWHVDRAWRKALKERIPLNENRIDVYHHLRTLLTELQPDKFRSLLQKFVSFLSNCHPQFCSYL